jgi:predicted DNA-binding transcriptional regulator AlpA
MQKQFQKRRLLSLKDASTYSGMSRSTLYAQEKIGRLQFTRILGSTRIEVSELDRWIDDASRRLAKTVPLADGPVERNS